MPRMPFAQGRRQDGRVLTGTLRERHYLREGAQLSIAFAGLAVLATQRGPWSSADLLAVAILLGCGMWRR